MLHIDRYFLHLQHGVFQQNRLKAAFRGGLIKRQLRAVHQGGPVSYISISSAIANTSSSSTPRYLTVLSILGCLSSKWTAGMFPFFL